MVSFTRRGLLALAALSSALTGTMTHAQFVKPPTGLTRAIGNAGVPVRYKQVPAGICELDRGVKSYSGYVDVQADEHIFFWFFEAREGDPRKAPLTVWINGGPGASSMIGLFEELGPCRIDPQGKVYSNKYSWSNVSNMIFIDQPAQVGFSYSKPVNAYRDKGSIVTLPTAECPPYAPKGTCGTYAYPDLKLTDKSTHGAARNMWKTLQGFLGVFPQYANHGVNFATESYGGHYGPIFVEFIEKMNERRTPHTKGIDLRALLIGNGWYDPIVQYPAYYNFTVSPGNTYDYAPFNESTKSMFYNNVYGRGNCVDRLQDCRKTKNNAICANADNFCANLVESVYDDLLGRDEYDMRELTPDPFPYRYYVDYLNQAHVQAAIGAYTNFSSNGAVAEAFASTGDDAREAGTIHALRSYLRRGRPVALYAGDADYNCNWLGNEAVAEAVGAHAPRPRFAAAGYRDLRTTDGVVHGQVRQAGLFSFTRFYRAGHEVPFYQPLASLEFFRRAIGPRDIESGLVRLRPGSRYRTLGPRRSTYREGRAALQSAVTPANLTYDVHAGQPGAPWPAPAPPSARHGLDMIRRSFRAGRGAGARPRSGFGGD